jgi:two-component system chemotaxis sensor kinase CheA
VAQDPYKYFRVEARELLDQLGRGILDLEKSDAAAGLVPRLLRAAHTLKGAARVVKQADIAEHAHAIEDALIPFRQSAGSLPREDIELLLRRVDSISERLAPLVQGIEDGSSVEGEASAKKVSEPRTRTVRADVEVFDGLLDGLAETHVQVGTLRRQLRVLEQAGHRVNLLIDQGNARRRQEAVAPLSRRSGQDSTSEQTRSIAEELRAILGRLERGVAASLDRMDRELREVRDSAEQLRLASAGTLFTSLERGARDAAELLGKSIVFEHVGDEVRLDAHMLDVAQGALHQLVRNAVAHGIELPPLRSAAGKSVNGKIRVSVTREGRRVLFRCQDDGAGVDLKAVQRVAERRGLLPATARDLDVENLLRTLLRGGVSTSGAVTQVAGRGIGLDVVRAAAESLGGEVSVQTAAGTGTTVELSVPASLAAIDALLVEVGGRIAAIPLDGVRHTLRIESDGIASGVNGQSVIYAGQVVPFAPLAPVLKWGAAAQGGRRAWCVVIVEGAEGRAAIGVERLCGTTSLMLRPLSKLAPSLTLLSGASLDAEGNAQIVLDPNALVRATAVLGAIVAEPQKTRRPVLIVDDSLTTRMLEQSILESAGFEVDMAMSGEEALEAAARKRYALFLVDVEMPGMDGFTFIERCGLDSTLRDIPAILVTSRESPEDRRRGDAVGARGYMVKADFDQAALLDRIRQLVQ